MRKLVKKDTGEELGICTAPEFPGANFITYKNGEEICTYGMFFTEVSGEEFLDKLVEFFNPKTEARK